MEIYFLPFRMVKLMCFAFRAFFRALLKIQIVYFLIFKHFQFLMPVGFHVVFVFRKAVMFIRNDEPQNVPSGFTDLLQSYAAVLIDTGNHITAMEGLPYMASVRVGNRNLVWRLLCPVFLWQTEAETGIIKLAIEKANLWNRE